MSTTTVSTLSATLNIRLKRGATWQATLYRAKNRISTDPVVEVPANLTGSTYSLQVRPSAWQTGEPFLNLDNTYFTLGQSQSAIDYDTAEANPAGTTEDEVYVEVPFGEMSFTPGIWKWDLRRVDVNGVVSYPLSGTFFFETEVTKP